MIDIKKEIEIRREEWSDAVNTKDLVKYLELLAEDVAWFPPGQPVIRGRSGFKRWVKPFFDTYDYQFELIEPRVSLSEEWAVEKGNFRSTMTENGRRTVHTGQYLIIWRKFSDNAWRIERYVDLTALSRESA